ncbi:uncharacterized protein [Macrobrachium rosenbergii]|uniref:uncharacterized protein isoform X1 n=1 Tax=Macrobrachium rosenbergii TaxID=79674 RepID=UPI0034D44AA8
MLFKKGLVECVCLLLWIAGNNKNLSEACLKGPFRRTITIEHHVTQPSKKASLLPLGKGGNTAWVDQTTYRPGPRIPEPFVTSKITKVEPPKPVHLDCNKNITIQNLSTIHWQTPNYPQPYPEGITCRLRFQYPNHQPPRGIAVLSMEVPSMIFTADGELCPGDRLTIERLPDGHVESLCGNLSGRTILVDVSLLRTLTFSTTPYDGGASIGFRVGIKGFLLG